MMWASGRNTEGELGLGNEESNKLPKNIVQLNDFPIKKFCMSNCHTVLMTSKGDVHVAGSTLHGKLGMPGIQKKFLNKFHVVTQLQGEKVQDICCSDYITVILLEDGRVFQLGGSQFMSTANVPKDANEATGVPGLDGVEIV